MENAQQSNKRSVADQLREAGECASRGMVQEALDIIAGLRKLYPKNIYIIGLRKQIQKLLTSPDSGTRKDILASFPQLTERAILEATVSERLEKNRSVQIEETQARSRAAALDRLKAQYLGHAERYFQKGEYEKALIEVRRIQIISPGDEQVDSFEKKLIRLIENPNSPSDMLIQRNEGPASSRTVEELLSKRPGPNQFVGESSGHQQLAVQGEPRSVAAATKAIASTVSKGTRILRWVVIIAVLFAIAAVIFLSIRSSVNEARSGNLSSDSLAQMFAKAEKPVFEEPSVRTSPPVEVEEQRPPIAAGPETTQAPAEVEEQQSPIAAEPETTQAPAEAVQEVPPPPPVFAENVVKHETGTPPPVEEPAPDVATPAVPQRDTVGFAALRSASESLPTPPRIVHLSAPTYPDSARFVHLSGQVIVLVQLDKMGHPLLAKVYKSSHPVFDIPAQQAALRSVYTGGAVEAGNVSSWIAVPFLFRADRSDMSSKE